ncbi:hypothetical protein SD81_009180 [Tolypothrix campylonemoides VB511288]|nr:hypothetical protein SD81_009180 [Tolypothrix campylonemoides VB511288]
MTVPINKTLLALSLALKDLEAPLSENEQQAFRDAANQLQLDSNNWEDYEPDLLQVIAANLSLNQLYQTAKSQLDALNGEIPFNLLPTQAELQQALPEIPQLSTRGFAPQNNDDDSNEINNILINILATSNPPETVKKLSRFEQLQQFLQNSLKRK